MHPWPEMPSVTTTERFRRQPNRHKASSSRPSGRSKMMGSSSNAAATEGNERERVAPFRSCLLRAVVKNPYYVYNSASLPRSYFLPKQIHLLAAGAA